MIVTYKGIVYPKHIDHMGHMNVQWYVQKFDQATWHLFSAIGITSTYIQENTKGMAAIEQKIKYKKEALSGDVLTIKSKVLEMKEKSIRFLHVMSNTETEEELAICELLGVHIDLEKRKSCPFPDSIYKNGLELIS